MTREEAIDIIENKIQIDVRFCTKEEVEQYQEALTMAITALRPVSREQVEKVWPGCHKCRTCDSCAYRTIKPEEEPCFSCNTDIYSNYKPEPGRMFCSTCGAPITDEAVQMVMERLEALKDGDLE